MMAREEDATDSAKVVAGAEVAAGAFDTSVTTTAAPEADRIEPKPAASFRRAEIGRERFPQPHASAATIGPAAKEALAKRRLGTTEVVATIQRRAR
jgi:hypothetical protein